MAQSPAKSFPGSTWVVGVAVSLGPMYLLFNWLGNLDGPHLDIVFTLYESTKPLINMFPGASAVTGLLVMLLPLVINRSVISLGLLLTKVWTPPIPILGYSTLAHNSEKSPQ